MEFELGKAMLILEKTLSVLNVFLKGLPQDWTHKNEGENTWSPYDIVGHLIHGEKTDWLVRTEIILGNDAYKKFEPFDRFAQFENSKGKSLDELLDVFGQLRGENLKKLRTMNLSAKDLMLEGIHPKFRKITLRQLLSAWVVHDLGHVVQISRVMAKQYQTEVGPWVEYLNILKN